MATTPKKNGGGGAAAAAYKKRRSLVTWVTTALAVVAVCGVLLAALLLSSSGEEQPSTSSSGNKAATSLTQQEDTNAGGSCRIKQCKAGGNEVCGTNGITYLNECFFHNAQCKNTSLDRVHDWKGYNCPHTCKKQIACNEVGVFLCASDGNVYFGYCNLYIAQCLDASIKEVECDKAIFADMFTRPTN